MIDTDQELQKYGLTKSEYESCLADITGKMNGQNDMDWAEIVEKYHLGIHADTLRKASQTIFGGAFISEYLTERHATRDVTNGYLAELQYAKEELKKERQKLSDERVDYQKSLREEARKESFIELIERTMTKVVEPLDYHPSPKIESDDDMVVCLSDLHTGIEVENWWNSYSIAILRQRLCNYIDRIKEVQQTHRCKRCELVLGGDNVSGLIHPNLRLQNNENVIEQIKHAITFIGDFVGALQDDFEEIRIHSVNGNHSRLSPNKAEHITGEELDALQD